ncbi:MAG TPA: hypothetical protein VJ672_17575 [Gemmatimonadaceae bacterium]|nr:hypothetical protein [Gemmatimonadaceae bacterium]
MPGTGKHRLPRATVQKRVVGAFTERLPLKFAALFFSLVLWLIVAAEEPAARELSVRLALTADSMVHVVEAPPDVHALVVGSGRDLLKLYATPPTIRRHLGNDSPETVVLDIRPTDVDLPSGVSARVQDVQPRAIPLRLDVRATRDVPVRSALRLIPPPGMRIAGPPRFEPETVRVSGRRTSVQSLDSVLTERMDMPAQDTARRIAIDTTGLGVSVLPAYVRVRVPLSRLDVSTPPTPDTAAAVLEDTTAPPRDTTPDTTKTDTTPTRQARPGARP